MSPGNTVVGLRQAAHLDPAGRLQLAGEPGRLLALLLDLSGAAIWRWLSASASVTTSIAVKSAPSASDGSAASNRSPRWR